MTKYLVSFPSEAMVLTDEELPIVSAESHAVIVEAKAAGVYRTAIPVTMRESLIQCAKSSPTTRHQCGR